MDKIRNLLSRFPGWLFTVLTILIILWLTLMPDPLGEDAPSLFPGADKLVHAVMFGFLTTMIMLDRQRRDNWRELGGNFIIASALVSALFGILIEVLQLEMDMGRGFEVADMVADAVGSFLCALGWKMFQGHWCKKSS